MQSYFVVARCLALVLWQILENNIVTLGYYSGAFGPVIFYSSHRRVFHVNLVSCVIGLLLSCYICLVELLADLLSYCLWLFVFSWLKSRRKSIDLGILPLLSCQTFFVSALSFPTKWYQSIDYC